MPKNQQVIWNHPNRIEDHRLNGVVPSILKQVRATIVGQRIQDIVYIDIAGDPWPCIILEDGSCLVIQRDDEGNGPGVISVEPNGAAGDLVCEASIKGS